MQRHPQHELKRRELAAGLAELDPGVVPETAVARVDLEPHELEEILGVHFQTTTDRDGGQVAIAVLDLAAGPRVALVHRAADLDPGTVVRASPHTLMNGLAASDVADALGVSTDDVTWLRHG